MLSSCSLKLMTVVHVNRYHHSIGDAEKKKSEDSSESNDGEKEENQENSESERSLSSEPEAPTFREGSVSQTCLISSPYSDCSRFR